MSDSVCRFDLKSNKLRKRCVRPVFPMVYLCNLLAVFPKEARNGLTAEREVSSLLRDLRGKAGAVNHLAIFLVHQSSVFGEGNRLILLSGQRNVEDFCEKLLTPRVKWPTRPWCSGTSEAQHGQINSTDHCAVW